MPGFDSIKLNRSKQNTAVGIEEISRKSIAIIGAAVRLPKADTADEFWKNLRDGIDCVRMIPETRKEDVEHYFNYIDRNRVEIKFGEAAYLEEIDKFDNAFFRLSPKEASLMDPNQRIFLETAWSALEDSGYGGKKLIGTRTGVYVGYGSDCDYKKMISEIEPSSLSLAVPGNSKPIIASRISYLMDFRGPSMMIDTTCSSSLVAVHTACMAIRNGECDLAIAGGIQLHILPIRQAEIGIESSDGRAKTFDDNSDGTGTGEGAVAILLKPLSNAIKDGDNIYAVIKGSAVNQDGSSIGITAPNAAAQEDVIVRAWKDAEVNPETITYIEAHGTGTKLGDPIEIDGIQRAFSKFTERKAFCAVGAVKTNIGHLDNTAGIAGLLKAVLSLGNGQLPPTLHFKRPNRKIDFIGSPVYINERLSEWKTAGFPKRCGVSSFGLSGTNCHVILEEAPALSNEVKSGCDGLNVLVLSAKSRASLEVLIGNYNKLIQAEKLPELKDICYTAGTGRGHYSYRIAFIVEDIGDLRQKLTRLQSAELETIKEENIYYQCHRIIPSDKPSQEKECITEQEAIELGNKAAVKINSFVEGNRQDKSILHEICSLYVKGADVDWEKLYTGLRTRKASLPGYPFERTRCWINIPLIMAEKDNFFYNIAWKQEAAVNIRRKAKQGAVLLIRDETDISEKLAKKFKADGEEVIEVRIGQEFKKISQDSYVIRIDSENMKKLLKDIGGKKLSQIIHLLTITDAEEEKELENLLQSQQRGVDSLFHLVKVLLDSGIKDGVDIFLVSRCVNEVTGNEEKLSPGGATLFGLGRVVDQEYPILNCMGIDIDTFTTAEEIYSELQTDSETFLVAYRGGKRYVEEFVKAEIMDSEIKETPVRSKGVYLITGGAGGIGIELAKYLASKGSVNIALVNRTKMPEHKEWEAILRQGNDKKLCSKIGSMLEIEQKGSVVECHSADVSDYDEIKSVIGLLRERYGNINGIIHSAGVAGDGFIIRKEKDDFDRVMLPKVKGTWLLDKLTESDNMDFFILCSSTNTIMGIPGQGDYTAANSYLDAFSSCRNKAGKRTLAVKWPIWKETGMALEYGAIQDTLLKAMSTAKVLKAFDKVLNRDMSLVVIGELNYGGSVHGKTLNDARIRISNEIIVEMDKHRKNPGQVPILQECSADEVVSLKGKDDTDYTDTEQRIANIWRAVLGFEELNVYDNFFEIGGDSILVTRVHALLEEKFPGKTTITDLFAYPTISKLAQHISGDNDVPVQDSSSENFEEDMENDILGLLDEMEKGNLSLEKAMSDFDQLGWKNE
ncbi:MAG: SDR family NAD(P)-dependent oxidoreductase [Clostridia bacterium]|nr:SDR family NAD(P)-dependent oxidoreductase [Clostridia bacterium]